MNESAYYRVSVKAIAVDETGRFMLSREADGKWDMLGGGLDHGEEPIMALQREIKEETGLEITHVSDTPKYFVTGPRFGHDTFVANVIYEVKLVNLDFTPSDECQELKFFTVDEARKLNVFPTVEKFLEVFDPALHT